MLPCHNVISHKNNAQAEGHNSPPYPSQGIDPDLTNVFLNKERVQNVDTQRHGMMGSRTAKCTRRYKRSHETTRLMPSETHLKSYFIQVLLLEIHSNGRRHCIDCNTEGWASVDTYAIHSGRILRNNKKVNK